jgi:hypothetical protein
MNKPSAYNEIPPWEVGSPDCSFNDLFNSESNQYSPEMCSSLLRALADEEERKSRQNCQGSGSWETEGWWVITPGNTVHVANTCNRYLYFYAEAVNGEYWAGNYDFEISEGEFDFCPSAGVGIQGATVGMRELDNNIGGTCWPWDSYTLQLVG